MKKRFDNIYATQGDDVVINFKVTDKNDNAVDVTSATGTFKIARRESLNTLLSLDNDNGITYTGSTVTVAFNTGDIENVTIPYDEIWRIFDCQLRLTIADKTMVSSYGELHLSPLIGCE